MSRKQWIVAVAGLIATMTALAGCKSLTASSKPRHAWEIQVDAVGGIASKSVEVHLIGVEEDETALWSNISMTEYWRPGSGFRGSELRNMAVAGNRVKVMRFGPGKDPNQVYTDGSKDPNDPWNRWTARAKGAPLFLMVLADLPGRFDDLPGDEDPRRLTLPLDPKKWEGRPRIIRIEVQDWGLRRVTKPKPERPKRRFLLF